MDAEPTKGTLRVGVVGLGFGVEFLPIYRDHPDVDLVAVCQRGESRLNAVADAFGVERRYTDYWAMLADSDLDAVHINTPTPDHARHTLAALRSGLHVACAVPMATTVKDCHEIVRTVSTSGLTYMMMETSVFSGKFLFARDLYRSGQLGRIQSVRGMHHQDMMGWPSYWEGLPPMHYSTHAVGPCLALVNRPAESVVCKGSGRIEESLIRRHDSPYAVQTALVTLADSDVVVEITRSLFQTAREYIEGFSVYGSLMSLEWEQVLGFRPVLFTQDGRQWVDIPDYSDALPRPIRKYTSTLAEDVAGSVISLPHGDLHGGSHPQLAAEFVACALSGRTPQVDAPTAANWTCVGFAAHRSAKAGGLPVGVPFWP